MSETPTPEPTPEISDAEYVAELGQSLTAVLNSFGMEPVATVDTDTDPNPTMMRVLILTNPINPYLPILNPRILERALPDGTKEFEMETPTRVVTPQGEFDGTVRDSWAEGRGAITSGERAIDARGSIFFTSEPHETKDKSGLAAVRQRIDQNFEPLSEENQKFTERISKRVARRDRAHAMLGKMGLGRLAK
jgi:hypothetical protein